MAVWHKEKIFGGYSWNFDLESMEASDLDGDLEKFAWRCDTLEATVPWVIKGAELVGYSESDFTAEQWLSIARAATNHNCTEGWFGAVDIDTLENILRAHEN